MTEQRPEPPDSLLSRPEVRAGAAALGGGLLAALIVLVVFLAFGGDDGGDDDEQVVASPTAPSATQPEANEGAPTALPTATTTPAGPTDPLQALEEFLTDEFDVAFIGDCPQEIPPSGVPEGYCAKELHDSDLLVTYFVGPAFSEAAGEAVLTRKPDRSWSVDFIQAPALGEGIAVGDEAMVFGVGSCLNFRESPSANAPRLTCQIDGTSARVLEGPVEEQVEEGTVTWWRLEGLGWASDAYLSPSTE